jgi:hypothetical protein
MKTLFSFFQLILYSLLAILGIVLVLVYFSLTDDPGLLSRLTQTHIVLPDLKLTGLSLPDAIPAGLVSPETSGVQITVVGKGMVEKVNPLATQPLPIVATLPMPTPKPTSAPALPPPPTRTPVPPMDPAEYQTEAIIRLKHFASALQNWLATNDRLMRDNHLLDDPGWNNAVKGNLAEIAATGRALAAIGRPPVVYAGIDAWFKRVGPESESLQASYLRALETRSPGDFQAAGDHFTRIKSDLTQAAGLMITAGWDLNQ